MRRIPLESWEQERIAKWLDAQGLLWCHVPNELITMVLSHRTNISRGEVRSLMTQGVKAGVPDILIFDPPSTGEIGVAIELKRRPPKFNHPSELQKHWLKSLENVGWLTYVAKGAIDGIQFLRGLYIEHCPDWELT